jgi:hypothetical protein
VAQFPARADRVSFRGTHREPGRAIVFIRVYFQSAADRFDLRDTPRRLNIYTLISPGK